MTYKVHLKIPRARGIVWAGPQHQTGHLPTPESDKDKTRRENAGHRLEVLTGSKPQWHPNQYYYTIGLEPEQAKEVAGWEFVRRVEKE